MAISTIFENVLEAIRNNSQLLIFLWKNTAFPTQARFCLISMNFCFLFPSRSLTFRFQIIVHILWNYYVEWSWIYFRMLKNTQNIDRLQRTSAMCVDISFLAALLFFVLQIVSWDWSLLGFSSKWMEWIKFSSSWENFIQSAKSTVFFFYAYALDRYTSNLFIYFQSYADKSHRRINLCQNLLRRINSIHFQSAMCISMFMVHDLTIFNDNTRCGYPLK